MDSVKEAREALDQAQREAFMERLRVDGGCPTTLNVWMQPGSIQVRIMIRPDHTWEFQP